MSETLGQLIRTRRQELEMTREQFAELLGKGVRQSDVSRLEWGRVTQPRPERLRRIAVVLDIPMGTLLTLTSWAEPEPASRVVSFAEKRAEKAPLTQRSAVDQAIHYVPEVSSGPRGS